MKEYKDYKSYDYDTITEGSKIKIEHTVYGEPDISDLVSKPLAELLALREESRNAEQAAYENVRQAARQWEPYAVVTRQIDRAIEYLKVPEVSHTSNKWEKDRYDKFTISNRVYKMTYDIYERSSWRSETKKYDVRWNIYTNRPSPQSSYKVAGQERVCSTREEAEKYIQGRIKAYSHLFTEISPSIPKEYEPSFTVHGQLLPGYTTVEMQKAKETEKAKTAEKKPSIRQQLNSEKAKEKAETSPPVQKRSAPEL